MVFHNPMMEDWFLCLPENGIKYAQTYKQVAEEEGREGSHNAVGSVDTKAFYQDACGLWDVGKEAQLPYGSGFDSLFRDFASVGQLETPKFILCVSNDRQLTSPGLIPASHLVCQSTVSSAVY